MIEWYWPQWAVAAFQLLAAVGYLSSWIRDKRISAAMVVLRTAVYIALLLGYNGVLSAGGFW